MNTEAHHKNHNGYGIQRGTDNYYLRLQRSAPWSARANSFEIAPAVYATDTVMELNATSEF